MSCYRCGSENTELVVCEKTLANDRVCLDCGREETIGFGLLHGTRATK